MKLKVLVAGSSGQLGYELIKTVPEQVHLEAMDRTRLDITDKMGISRIVSEIRPDWIINAAAYTAVDKAEEQPEIAYLVNRDGAKNLAMAARSVDAKLVHVSTDFVFDGQKGSPYTVEDAPNPQSVYGASKYAGEQEVLNVLAGDVLIIRAAWVYSSYGHNFVKTMLRLMEEREDLGIVSDQIGSPTYARRFARAIWLSVDKKITGMYHWTDAGVASWYDFAVAIYEEAKSMGILSSSQECSIRPILTRDYPVPATRPSYSVLDKTKIWSALGQKPIHWRVALREMLEELV